MKLNNIPLELDNRIYDIADIKTVITADENDVGKMGYFANSIHLFENLKGSNGIKYGKLIYLSDLDYGGDKSDKCFVCGDQWAYRYFIPEDALKSEEPEKKYRAFTLNEFVNQYSLGDEVIMRIKDDPTSKHVLFVGYEEGGDDVLLGQYWNTFMILFNNYELYIDGKWQPFGIIDESQE